jgi:hypothetical protein
MPCRLNFRLFIPDPVASPLKLFPGMNLSNPNAFASSKQQLSGMTGLSQIELFDHFRSWLHSPDGLNPFGFLSFTPEDSRIFCALECLFFCFSSQWRISGILSFRFAHFGGPPFDLQVRTFAARVFHISQRRVLDRAQERPQAKCLSSHFWTARE